MISTKHHRLKTKLQFILQHINKDETASRKNEVPTGACNRTVFDLSGVRATMWSKQRAKTDTCRNRSIKT